MAKSKKQTKTKADANNKIIVNNQKKLKSNFSTTRTTTTTTNTKNNNEDDTKSISFPPSLLEYKRKQNDKNFYNNTPKITPLVKSAVFIQPNFFSVQECNAWIEHAERNIQFEYMKSPQTREYAQRECGRIQLNDWDMASLLYVRMKPMVDFMMGDDNNTEEEEGQRGGGGGGGVNVTNFYPSYGPVCCNGNLRMYKYEKGMSFGRHYDGSNRIERYENGNTEITVLIYLSSCKGGATRFYLPHGGKGNGGGGRRSKNDNGKKKDASSSNYEDGDNDGIAFVPQAGAILMHMHGDRCLEHEADPVVDGVKYVLRTDIVFANSDKILK